MRILITGGTGFIGKKLAAALLRQGAVALDGGEPARRSSRITLFDAFPGEGVPRDPRVDARHRRHRRRAPRSSRLAAEADLVWHLAAIVSGNAEADFDLGYRVNLDGTRVAARGAARHRGAGRASSSPARSRSSAATCREVITTSTHAHAADLLRHPEGDRRAAGQPTSAARASSTAARLRLPTIVVRPGKPNKAASTFASSIIREPLAGQEAVCPVSRDAAHVHPLAAPRRRGAAPRHAPARRRLGHEPQPARSPASPSSIGEMVERLAPHRRRGASSAASAGSPTRTIQRIVAGWPARAAGATRAQRWASRPTALRRDHRGAHRGRAGRQVRELRVPC